MAQVSTLQTFPKCVPQNEFTLRWHIPLNAAFPRPPLNACSMDRSTTLHSTNIGVGSILVCVSLSGLEAKLGSGLCVVVVVGGIWVAGVGSGWQLGLWVTGRGTWDVDLTG